MGVSFGTDLFNHSKGLFFNRALDKLSECQYNMSFHVQKWQDISWLDVPSKKQIKKEGKKGGEKTMGGNRKKRKRKKEEKKEKKERKKEKSQNKRKEREKEGGGMKIEWRTERKKKEKRVGIKYLTKGSTVLGLNPVHWYI